MSQRTLIVGDIHGCFDELRELCDLVGPDRVVSVGDMVDRGPDGPAVWRFFADREDTVAVRGNHEQKCFRWHRGELRPALSQRISRRQFGADWAEACAGFEGLPLWLELEEALVVHGFWEPGKRLDEQHPTVLVGTMSGARRIERLDRPWYELYDGEKPLVVGHAVYDEDRPLVWRDRVFGLDTGCVHGGKLTGLVLPDFRLVQVDARADYWGATKAANVDLKYAGVDPALMTWDAAEASLPWLQRDPAGHSRAREVAAMLEEAGEAEAELLARVEREHAAAEVALPAGYEAAAYARLVADSPIERLLHRRRVHGFGQDELRRRWRRPAELLGFVGSTRPPAPTA